MTKIELKCYYSLSDCHHIVTSAENGEMFAWDTVDGRCLESKKLTYVHTSLQPYRFVPIYVSKKTYRALFLLRLVMF
jgi:hypothetical protein